MEQVIADLISHVNAEEFSSIVICVNSLGPIAAELEKLGVRVMRLDKMIPILSFIYPGKLVKVMRALRPDVIHVHSGCWHKAAFAAWLTRIRTVIYTEHGRFFPDRKIVMFLDRLCAPLTKHVVTVSANLEEYMCKKVGIPKDKIVTINNGINVDRFQNSRISHPGNDGIKIGIIARLAPVKDIGMLLRAMAIIHQSKKDILLLIVGDGPERDYLASLSEELGLQKVVTFYGMRRDIPAVLQEIDIFVLSSLSEGTSITLLEAMAAGKPVVVTAVGGSPAIVEHGINGFLVPPGNPGALAQALQHLSEEPVLLQKMAEENIRKVMAHYSIQAMACSYEALYRENVC